MELQKSYLGHPATPGEFKKYFQAWKRLWSFYNFTKIFRTFKNSRKLWKKITSLEKDCGAAEKLFRTSRHSSRLNNIFTSLEKIMNFLQIHKNHLGPPGTPGDFTKYLQA